MEISSYVDAESSDDDVYCDSVNPDEVCSLLINYFPLLLYYVFYFCSVPFSYYLVKNSGSKHS